VRPAGLFALAAVLIAFGGCGATDTSTPAACLEGPAAYLRALRTAPGQVTLSDGTAISGCLVENQEPGDLATVGSAMLAAATTLNAAARHDPGGAANLRLGYLLGAAQRGAEGSNGIHAELVRRLSVAASYTPGKQVLPARFEKTYREGFDAGRSHG
jgi:hypothetical protein